MRLNLSEELFTLSQVARILKVHRETAKYHLRNHKCFRGFKDAGADNRLTWYFDEKAIRNLEKCLRRNR